MRQHKLTVAQAIAQGPHRPGVKLGVDRPPPPRKISPLEEVRAHKLVTRKMVASVYEVVEPVSVHEAVERATASKHGLTDTEVARVIHLVSGWAAKKQKSAAKNTARIQTAIDMVAKERSFPQEERPLATITSITSLSIRPPQQRSLVQHTGTFDAAGYAALCEQCPTPFVVTVTDRYGTPVMGAMVTFMIDAKNSY